MISTPAFPIHTFFECPAGSADGSWLSLDHAWVWIIMFLSQVNIRSSDYINIECQPWLGLSLVVFLLLRFLDAARCTREFFCETPGMDQLTHLDSKKSTPGSHRPDIWVRKLHYPENFDLNIILFLRTSYYNSLLVEQSMMLNRRSDDGKKSRKFDFKTKHFR